jgi:drug/metabolite transporter (DMT)-like permease
MLLHVGFRTHLRYHPVAETPDSAGMPVVSTAVRGILWMALAAMFFAITFALIRQLSETMHTFQIVLVRSLFALLVMLPWLCKAGLGRLRTRRWARYSVRALVAYIAMVCWFFALSKMALADATALQFTMPLWAVLFGIFLLGEKARANRWIVTLVGFIGALVIIRPGLIDTEMASLAALTAAAFYSAGNILIKTLSTTDDSTVIAFLGFLFSLPLAIPLAILVWTPVGWSDMPAIIGFGLSTAGAQVALARALTLADASVVAPVDYLRLPVVALLGFVFSGEVPDIWTGLGAFIIVASTWYLTASETRA